MTPRQALRDALREGVWSAHELSVEVRLSEKDVASHLEHLQRSLGRGDERLVVTPAVCLGCGFEFRKREKLGRPGRCPSCRSGRIDPPRFSIEER